VAKPGIEKTIVITVGFRYAQPDLSAISFFPFDVMTELIRRDGRAADKFVWNEFERARHDPQGQTTRM
jgi:hypothetical protein